MINSAPWPTIHRLVCTEAGEWPTIHRRVCAEAGDEHFVDKELFHVKPRESGTAGDGSPGAGPPRAGQGLSLAGLQARIEATFGERDRVRGVDGTFRWWVEEVGEVAKALRRRDPAELEHELGDALAWLVSVANAVGVDLNRAVARFADGCPRCQHSPCTCPMA